jgi:hypothetical protein
MPPIKCIHPRAILHDSCYGFEQIPNFVAQPVQNMDYALRNHLEDVALRNCLQASLRNFGIRIFSDNSGSTWDSVPLWYTKNL